MCAVDDASILFRYCFHFSWCVLCLVLCVSKGRESLDSGGCDNYVAIVNVHLPEFDMHLVANLSQVSKAEAFGFLQINDRQLLPVIHHSRDFPLNFLISASLNNESPNRSFPSKGNGRSACEPDFVELERPEANPPGSFRGSDLLFFCGQFHLFFCVCVLVCVFGEWLALNFCPALLNIKSFHP